MSTADLDQKKAQYAVAVARWEKAKTLRDYTVIRAPFAGIVTEKYARIGQKVIEDKGEPLFKITAVEPLLARVYLPEEELLNVKLGERVDVVAERFPDAKTTGEVQFISPAVDPGERHLPGRRPRPPRGRAARCCGPGSRSRSASREPPPADGRGDKAMAAPSPRSPSQLRSTLDRVLVHDIKNISFRLRLLLSNLDEHWEDPEFRKTVRELLASTVERLEDIVGRFAAHEDAVLIKVALDVNGLLRGRGGQAGAPGPAGARRRQRKLALGAVPRIWGDPFYLGDAFASLLENAFEAAGPEGTVLVRSYAGGHRAPARACSSRSSTTAPG